jgi:signal transduction histidine kinase
LPSHATGILPAPVQKLLELTYETAQPKHEQFLDNVVELLQDSKGKRESFVILWLYDWIKNCYRLTEISHNLISSEDFKGRMGSIVVQAPRGDFDFETPIRGDVRSSDVLYQKMQDEIAGLAVREHVCAFELTYKVSPNNGGNVEEEDRHVGVLQVWSRQPIPEEEKNVLEWVARALARNLKRSRGTRELQMLHELQQTLEGNSVENYLRGAAGAISKATGADHCLIFCPIPDAKLQAVAGWSKSQTNMPDLTLFEAGDESLIRQIFEGFKQTPEGESASKELGDVIRISNFNCEAERQSVFGHVGYDKILQRHIGKFLNNAEQRAWMGARIEAEDQVLGVIVLLNKSRYLIQQFSATDESVIKAGARQLASVLPSLLIRLMLEETSEVEGAILAQQRTDDEDRPLANFKGYFKLLQKYIPNISGASLWLGGEVTGRSGELIHLGGKDPFFQLHPDLIESDTSSEDVQVWDAEGKKTYYVLRAVNGLRVLNAKLGLVLASAQFGGLEKHMLKLFMQAVVLSQLRARDEVQRQLNSIIEIRHNLRGGLNGLFGLQTLVNFLLRSRGNHYAQISAHGEDILKSILQAQFYCAQTRALLEASRILTVGLTSKDINASNESLLEIVEEVIEVINADPEYYNVTVEFSQKILRNELANVDRIYIYILFFNLLENAVKYSVKGEPVQVRLSLPDLSWRFEVVNHGPFLDDAAKKKIFEPFIRGFKSELRHARPGTGLGLPTCEAIAKAHKGKIEVKSEDLTPQQENNKTGKNTFIVICPRRII